MSEDGSRIVFSTAEPLAVNAINGLANVYEWHKDPSGGAEVELISTGAADAAVEETVMSESGNDVFFATVDDLVAPDTDGQRDVYDARLGSGFPPPPTPLRPCSGDACQGPLTNPAPLLVPGSVSQAPGENVSSSPAPGPNSNSKIQKLARALRACRHRHGKSRSRCDRQARRRYAIKAAHTSTSPKGGR